MDILPEQQPSLEDNKEVILETSIPRGIANVLMRDVFTIEGIMEIETNVKSLGAIADKRGIDPQWLNSISQASMRIHIILGDLWSKKEVVLVGKNGGWDFRFSGEDKDENEKIPEGETLLDPATQTKLISALQHNFSNESFKILGYSDLITSQFNNQNNALLIKEICEGMNSKFLQLFTKDTQMKFVTDQQGNTNMSLIPVAPVQTSQPPTSQEQS